MDFIFFQIAPGVFKDACGHPHISGDLQRVTHTGRAVVQPEGGTTFCLIERRRGIDGPFIQKSIRLQPVQVGGYGHTCPQAGKIVQSGHGKGSPFIRVGAHARFINNDEAPLVRILQDIFQVRRVSRKGAKAIFYILIIPDISHDLIKDRQTTPFLRGDMDAGLGHEAQYPQRL